MKKYLLIFMLSALSQSFFAQEAISIIPLPKSYEPVKESFDLDRQIKIAFDEAFTGEAYYLQKQLFSYKGIVAIFDKSANKADISLIRKGSVNDVKGAYSIRMKVNRIEITAAEDEGIFNGIASVLQMVVTSTNKRIACWNIDDAPLHEWRGFMLDESRHFFGKEKLKQLLDYMALYKLNRFHWHLTDEPGWRMEIKKYPLLTYTGGVGNFTDNNAPPRYYTQEEIKEIVSYAAERKIVVIPEIDMPGHARAANRAYPQFSGGGSARYPEFTFDPGNEKTYQYLTDILKEVNVLFPSEMIHLGGDEVHFGNEQWNHNEGVKALMKREGMTDLSQVEKYFMVRMADSLFAMNNKLLAWDEMAEISLPTDKTIIFWWRHDQKAQLQKALDKKYPVVLCPRIPFYFDFVQDESHKVGRRWSKDFSDLEKVYKFSTNNLVADKYKNQVLGFQANLWTEVVKSEQRMDFMIYPRISALAEATWGQNNNYDEYLNRLKLQFPLYKKSNIYYFNPFDLTEQAEPKK